MPYAIKPGAFSSHGRILRWLESRPRDLRILDVGTAAGYLGQALGERGFAHVDGVERAPDLAEQARPFYRSLTACDVEHDPLPWPDASFDVVLCADILEHLRDPASALARLVRMTRPAGWMLISLPNVVHWSMRLGVLAGRFDYAASGLLDRTHLRFFTRATARRLVRSAGLQIRAELATPLPIAHWYRNGSIWNPVWRALERVDCAFVSLAPTVCAYQFVFVAQRPGDGP